MKVTKRLNEKPNIKNIIIIIFVILIIVIFMIYRSKDQEYNFDNLTVYKNGTEIILSDVEKESIIGYISRTDLKKTQAECIASNVYLIKFDHVELSFGNDNCDALYKNNFTEENYNTILSEDFKKYIINISN